MVSVVELNRSATGITAVEVAKSEEIVFTQQQQKFLDEALEWLANPRAHPQLMALHGYAGAGKSFVVKHLLRLARAQGILAARSFGEDDEPTGDIVWATAPTHIAKNVLARASGGSGISEFLTSHSFFGLRPQRVEFKLEHKQELDRLLAIEDTHKTSDEFLRIDALIWRRNAAAEQVREFLPTRPKAGAEHVRLLIVDEFSMINETLARLYFEFPTTSWFEQGKKDELVSPHPELQILFLGDPAQMPPIGEKESLICKVPKFTPLTEVVRNQGDILEYCTAVREAPERSLPTLHYRFDGEDVMLLTQHEVFSGLKEVIETGKTVRFIAGTNERCREINELARYTLKGIEEGLVYFPGDVVLSLSAIERDYDYYNGRFNGYGLKCGGKNATAQAQTSTLFELGDELNPGDVVEIASDARKSRKKTGVEIALDENSFTFVSHFGTTFHRRLFTYREYGSSSDFTKKSVLALLNPAEYGQWIEECNLLWARARTTSTTSKKNSRGQCGDKAKSVWAEFGLKNWDKKLDGSPLSDAGYKIIYGKVWGDAFKLSQFSDRASFSHASTAHRSQGITTQIAILDERTLMKSQVGRFSEDFDIRKLIYTAASRASEQLIIMQ
jgi:hypothetical protein